MTVEKTFGFGNGSPYNTSTFNKNNELIFGRNGALQIGSIRNSGASVLIDNVTFIQNGIIVQKVGTVTVSFPVSLPAPFYLTATVPDNRQVDNIAWSFVRRPQDIGANTVLIAEWDGSEWRHLPEISLDGIVRHRLSEAIAYRNLGFNSGFRFVTDPSFTTYELTPGQVTDKTGFLVTKLESTTFAALDEDPEYDRYDVLLWRRWVDDENRIGTLELRPGGTFSGSTPVQNHLTSVGSALNVNSKPKIFPLADNTFLMFYVEHYGDNGIVKGVKYAADRITQLIAPTSLATNATDYDVVVDQDENIMVVYVRDDNLYRTKYSSSFSILGPTASIDGLTNPVDKPTIRVDLLGNFYVTFLYQVSPSLWAPYFLRLNTGGTISVPSKKLIDSVNTYNKVHFDINADLELTVAYANQTLSTIEMQRLDEVGNSLGGRVTISTDTKYGLMTLTGSARNPSVHIAENNELYISFEQNKGASQYGVAFYSPTYENEFGVKAILKDFESSSENILDHKFALDWGNHAHILARTSTKIFYANLLLPFSSTRLVTPFTVNAVASGTFDIAFDPAGSLIQAFTNAQSGTTSNGSPITAILFGPDSYGVETVFISNQEVAVLTSSITALSPIPTIGDTFTIAGSVAGNNGTYTIESTRNVTIDGSAYTVFDIVTGTFFAEILGTVSIQFTKKNGNALYFCKQTAAVYYGFQEIKAEELASDIIAVIIRKSDNAFLTWYNESLIPSSGPSTIREEAFLVSPGAITWDKDTASGTLSWASDIAVRDPFRADFIIASGSQTGIIEDSVLYIKTPLAIPLDQDGDAEGVGVLSILDTTQFSIGQTVYVGDSDSNGVKVVITNIATGKLYFASSMAAFTVLRGGYVIPVDVPLYLGKQNEGELRPDSLGNIDKNIFVIAMRSDDLLHFRNGALTLTHGEDGHLGDGASDDTLTYIGATSDADNDPNYANNYAGTQGQNLTGRLGAIDKLVNDAAQDRNVIDIFPKGIAFTWDSVLGELTWTNGEWNILVPNVGTTPGVVHTVNTVTKKITIADNQVAYVDIDRLLGTGDLTAIAVNDNALPLDLSNQNHLVIARRKDDEITIGINGRFTLVNEETSAYPVSSVKLIKGGTWSWDQLSSTLSWSSTAYMQIPGLENTVNVISAGSGSLPADGDVLYVNVNRVSPGGSLTVIEDAVENIPINLNNIIIARRVGNNVLIGHNLLETDADLQLDQAFTDNMLTMLGFSSNGQVVHTYPSTYYITQSTSHEQAIGLLDLKVKQISDALLDPNTDTYIWLADGTTDTFTVGTAGHGDSLVTFSPDNSINDIMVTVDGLVLELHKSGITPIGDGDTDGEFVKTSANTIQIKSSALAGAGAGENRKKIIVRPYAAGMTHVVAVQDEGFAIETETSILNFTGAGVTATQTSPGIVEVNIPGGGGGGGGGTYEVFTVTNDTGSDIPIRKAIRFLANGRVELADNTVTGKKNPMGVTLKEIPNGATVTEAVAIGYRIPGALTGLGFAINERVFLGQNGDLVNEGSVPDTPSIDDSLIQVGEAYGSGASTTDLIWNKQEYAQF